MFSKNAKMQLTKLHIRYNEQKAYSAQATLPASFVYVLVYATSKRARLWRSPYQRPASAQRSA